MGEVMESCMKEICSGIELRYDWITFLEVGSDGDGFHYLVKITPGHSPEEIVHVVKTVTSKELSAKHPEVRQVLWGGELWNEGCAVESVGDDRITMDLEKRGKPEKIYKRLYASKIIKIDSPSILQ
jgi:REP element-mobilizing transposase RayT